MDNISASDVQDAYIQIMRRAPEHKIDPTLDRVKQALSIIGDPQENYPVISVTGTNGKTSTARMIDSLMSAWGSKTGRFTSPHLSQVNERISVAGENISDEDFVYAYNDVAPYVQMVDQQLVQGNTYTGQSEQEAVQMSFFEVLTVMAYAYFADVPVDVAIMEVGMGGRWDATNVVDAQVGVITHISLDHQQWLGDTLAEIATEKAGIIKRGQSVFVGSQDPQVAQILLEKAKQVDAQIYFVGQDMKVLSTKPAVSGQLITVQTPCAVYEDIFVPLMGRHQSENALLALCAAEAFYGGKALDAAVVEAGFANATSPGRMEIVKASPTIIVDCAHNHDGAVALSQALEENFGYYNVVGIYSAMADKDVENTLAQLEGQLQEIVLVQLPGARSMDIDQLQDIAVDVFGEDRVHVASDLPAAIDMATTISETSNTNPMITNAVLVFGSVVLAGMVRKMFIK